MLLHHQLLRDSHFLSFFQGHFIVLVSFDPKTDSFIYRDPGVVDEVCMISAKNFEAARQSPGTDEDCIVIKLF